MYYNTIYHITYERIYYNMKKHLTTGRLLALFLLLVTCLNSNLDSQLNAASLNPVKMSQTKNQEKLKLKYGATRKGKRQDKAMQKFRDNRLGAFVHWGLYAIPGGEWNGKMYRGAAEWLKAAARVPTKEWLSLMDQWNPKDYDPKAWAKMFKEMGVKYVKITTKHHEGFCLWPSKYTEYTVANTPYGKDLIGPLVEACNAEGIDVAFYFSFLDWSHPDYRYSLKTKEDREAFERFMEFSENQLRELATLYPTVTDFWFDGTWDASLKENGWWTAHIEKVLKELIPGVTINSRLRADDYGKRHFDSNGELMGDYESAYERRLPDPVKDLVVTTWDWEACMTVPENQWGYHKDWSLSYVKSNEEILERVVHAVSMGGNMLVNFGPMGNGDFRKEEKHIAKYIGRWMKKNGEAIYGCDYANLKKQDWGYFTKDKEGNVYMVVFNRPSSNLLRVNLPTGYIIDNATLVDGAKPGSRRTEVKYVSTMRGEYNIHAPKVHTKDPYVIKLHLGTNKYEARRLMKKVADWQIGQHDAQYAASKNPLKNAQNNVSYNIMSEHDDVSWTNAALYVGMADFAELVEQKDGKDTYYKWLKKVAGRNHYQLGKWMYHADFIAVAQAYIDLYKKYKNERILYHTLARTDWVIANPSKSTLELDYRKIETLDRWSWCDALFMAPPVYAKLYSLTGDEKYIDFLNKEYKATYDYLFDKEENLFYRDCRYFGKKEANGEKVFWGRGNGWVLAGLSEILQVIPKGDENREFYEELYLKLAKRVAGLQCNDGYWHASLLDPESYPSPETSATGMIVYALAYGVNEGLLDKDTYKPVIMKGWRAMTDAVLPDGKLGYVQQIGADPQYVTSDMTEVYGVGAFLLSGCQVYKLLDD